MRVCLKDAGVRKPLMSKVNDISLVLPKVANVILLLSMI